VNVRIGIANAKELEVEVEDADALVAAYEKALQGADSMMTIDEADGSRTIVSAEAILYFSFEPSEKPGIGFAAEG